MSRWLGVAAGAALLLAAAGCGGSSREDPGAFITRILHEELAGQWAAQWGELHPGHRQLITRAQYVTCSEAIGTNVATGHETLSVRGVRDVPIHVRNVPERSAKLVTIVLRSGAGDRPTTYHLHAVLDGGRWTWILGRSFLDALARGQCLDGSPLRPSR